jgi:hypothetical protein
MLVSYYIITTAAARVQTRVSLVMWDFVMDKSSAGADFLRELRFPLPIYIPSAAPQSSSLSPEAGTIGQESMPLLLHLSIL